VDSGYCVRCGETIESIKAAAYDETLRLLHETADELRTLRIQHAAGGNDAHWLVKDFHVLYAVTLDLLLAVGRGDETETAHALNFVAAQLDRLKPAFRETDEVRRILRERRRG
jgi:hypothetical protein